MWEAIEPILQNLQAVPIPRIFTANWLRSARRWVTSVRGELASIAAGELGFVRRPG
jgi:hypothetical protein